MADYRVEQVQIVKVAWHDNVRKLRDASVVTQLAESIRVHGVKQTAWPSRKG